MREEGITVKMEAKMKITRKRKNNGIRRKTICKKDEKRREYKKRNTQGI
jgi:hypothetical protein